MFLCCHKRFLSSLLLVPVAALFIVCCCLKVEASCTYKSSCASCPQKEKSPHQADCPHAKIKAVIDAAFFESHIVKTFFVLVHLVDSQYSILTRIIAPFVFYPLDTSQGYFSLSRQNPVLRV